MSSRGLKETAAISHANEPPFIKIRRFALRDGRPKLPHCEHLRCPLLRTTPANLTLHEGRMTLPRSGYLRSLLLQRATISPRLVYFLGYCVLLIPEFSEGVLFRSKNHLIQINLTLKHIINSDYVRLFNKIANSSTRSFDIFRRLL